MPTTSTNNITGTWSPAINNTATTTYTFTPTAGQCATTQTLATLINQSTAIPSLSCWQTATLNNSTCQWDVTGEQPAPPTLACWQTANFNNSTCQWEISGKQALQPSTTTQPVVPSLNAFYSGPFIGVNTTAADPIGWSWSVDAIADPSFDVVGGGAARMNVIGHNVKIDLGATVPTSVSYFLRSLGTGNRSLEVQYSLNGTAWLTAQTHTQATLPTQVAFLQTPIPANANFIRFILTVRTGGRMVLDGITVMGSGSNVTPLLSCWQTTNFNTATCQWDVTGTQPQAPTNLACWQEATFNTTTCQWNVTGTQPQAPTNLACWQTTNFNTTTCLWDVTGTQAQAPTLACWQNANFNTTTCQWDVTGTQPQAPTNLACWQTTNFNTTTCQWNVTGTQPQAPTNLACWQEATFNTTTCQWDVTGTQPQAPTLACWQNANFNSNTCNWTVSGVPPAVGVAIIASCSPIVWVDGITYSTSNYTATHTFVGGGVNGCDSIVTLKLTIAPCTNLNSTSCNATQVPINESLRANIVTGALVYRFRIVGPNSGAAGWLNNTFILDRPNRAMSFNLIPGIVWGSTYTVDVAVSMDGINFGAYGASCTVSLLEVQTSQLITTLCGATNVTPGTNIIANEILGAIGYRFKITGNNTSGWVNNTFIIDQPTRTFSINLIPGLIWGQTYTVEVAVLAQNETNYGPFGAACTLVFHFPTTILDVSSCGIVNVGLSTNLRANAISGAAGYRFKITGANTGITGWNNGSYLLDLPNRTFNLSIIPGVIYGQTYTIDVALLAQDGINYGPFGNICSVGVTSPITKLITSHCGISALVNFSLNAENIIGATGYRFKITGNNTGGPGWVGNEFILDRPTRDFRFNMITGIILGQTYSVEVAVRYQDNATYSVYGQACTVTLGNALMPMTNPNASTPLPIFEVASSQNPFTTDFGLQLKTDYSNELVDVLIYDLSGKQLEHHTLIPQEFDTARFGHFLVSGMYLIQVRQRENTILLRQIKN